ncbi:MAG: thioredoxin [Muribaculaceae bacterium]|nr:thioredoxin [Muribaculaceae bacterium]
MAFKFTDDNVNEIIESGKPVMIDFWATWCGPCMAMAPIVDELAEEYGDKIVIGKYNVEEEGDLSAQYRITSLPTILFFKDGKKADLRLAGSQTKANLKEAIEKILN